MYKSKPQIWVIAIILSLIIGTISKIKLPNIEFGSTKYTMYTELEEEFKERFDGYSIKKAKINVTSNKNSDIIIDKSSDKEISGYTKYPNQFSTEFIAYLQVGEFCGSTCELYEAIEDNINSFSDIIDLKKLFEAVENDKTYADLGIINTSGNHRDNNRDLDLNRPVKIYFPGKSLHYYQDAKLLVAYALNDYSYENIEDTNLLERVEKIIAKSGVYNSEKELERKVYFRENEDRRDIYIAPAYIKECPQQDTTPDNNYHYVAFYPLRSIDITYDMYLKETEDETYYDRLLVSLKKSYLFSHIGFKNIEVDYNKDNWWDEDDYCN